MSSWTNQIIFPLNNHSTFTSFAWKLWYFNFFSQIIFLRNISHNTRKSLLESDDELALQHLEREKRRNNDKTWNKIVNYWLYDLFFNKNDKIGRSERVTATLTLEHDNLRYTSLQLTCGTSTQSLFNGIRSLPVPAKARVAILRVQLFQIGLGEVETEEVCVFGTALGMIALRAHGHTPLHLLTIFESDIITFWRQIIFFIHWKKRTAHLRRICAGVFLWALAISCTDAISSKSPLDWPSDA